LEPPGFIGLVEEARDVAIPPELTAVERQEMPPVPVMVRLLLLAGRVGPEGGNLDEDVAVRGAPEHVAGASCLAWLDCDGGALVEAHDGEPGLGEGVQEPMGGDVLAGVTADGVVARNEFGREKFQAGPPADDLDVS